MSLLFVLSAIAVFCLKKNELQEIVIRNFCIRYSFV